MPTVELDVNNRHFNLSGSPSKLLREDKIFMSEMEKFKSGFNYIEQTDEEILDILVDKEDIDAQINAEARRLTDDYFQVSANNFSAEFDAVKTKLYDKYKNKYAKEFDNRTQKIDELEESIMEDLHVEGIYNDFSKDGEITTLGGIYEEVNKAFGYLTQEEIDENPDYFEKLDKWRKDVKELFDFQDILSTSDPKQEYINSKLSNLTKDLNYRNEPEYKKVAYKLAQAQGQYFQEKKTEFEMYGFTPHFQKLKNEISESKSQCADLLKERDNLAKEYYNTSLGSRIVRWLPFIPRSWSKAGQIQNEIDKIDKAIKDAGFEKKDVENVKAEMKKKSEKPDLKSENKKNDAVAYTQYMEKLKQIENNYEKTDEINNSLSNEELQQGLNDLINGSNDVNNSEKVEENNLDLQKNAIIKQ